VQPPAGVHELVEVGGLVRRAGRAAARCAGDVRGIEAGAEDERVRAGVDVAQFADEVAAVAAGQARSLTATSMS
jgi:hypothetical protein